MEAHIFCEACYDRWIRDGGNHITCCNGCYSNYIALANQKFSSPLTFTFGNVSCKVCQNIVNACVKEKMDDALKK